MATSLFNLWNFLLYVADWVVVIVVAIIAGHLSNITPNKRPFSLTDPQISFPYVQHEKISTALLVVLAVVVPAVVLFIVAVTLPFLSVILSRFGRRRNSGKPAFLGEKESFLDLLKRSILGWNRAWLGLGLSVATAFFVTDGLKNLIGHPRPDLLARCQPDMSATSISSNTLGGYSATSGAIGGVVSWTICTNTDTSMLDDGFRSWPSGHSSTSFAGLAYLTLYLIAVSRHIRYYLSAHSSSNLSTLQHPGGARLSFVVIGVAFVPLGLAAYISGTRYSDFRHHGFDILSGAALGIACAILGYWWFAMPRRFRLRDFIFGRLAGSGMDKQQPTTDATYANVTNNGGTHTSRRHWDVEEGRDTGDSYGSQAPMNGSGAVEMQPMDPTR